MWCRKIDGGLGLRYFSFFNKSLLTKHDWLINTKLNSLIAHLFKAVYFPTELGLIFCMGKGIAAKALAGDLVSINIHQDSQIILKDYLSEDAS